MNLIYYFKTMLKPIIVFTVFILSLCIEKSVCAQSQPMCPLGNEWNFISGFSDEFNGKKLDESKWWDFNPTMHGRKPAFFSRRNVAVKNGLLWLSANVQKPNEVTVENRVRGYDKFTTSIIKSKNRIKYGYFEARCKSMKASVSNAFWLYDPLDAPQKYREGSFSEEIDIFEIFGNPTKKANDQKYFMTVHQSRTPYVETLVKNLVNLENKSAEYAVSFKFYEDFHLYGLLWTPEMLTWYIDGKEVFSRKNDVFHTALNVVFDSEIMEAWAGLPDVKDLPAVFYVDYVRVWQKQ